MLLGSRTINKTEYPLNLQLQYGPHSSILEIRLVQIHDRRVAVSGLNNEANDYDEQIRQKRGNSSISPKDEGYLKIYSDHSFIGTVIDHGTANVELMMNEALQDVPTMVFDIQEKLKCVCSKISFV